MTHPLFSMGELVALRATPEILVPVLEVIPGTPEYRYRVFQNNTVATYYESQLQATERASGTLPVTIKEIQGQITALKLLSPSVSSLLSFGSGRVSFIPYQYRPVLKLIRADRPRLLIADEVGVGKTVEAALIIKELQARMDIRSVLVICPRPLVAERKWFTELRRFDEQFVALDGQLLQHCLHETHLEGEWPEPYAKAILPFSLFSADLLQGGGRGRATRRGLLSLDTPPRFDLVIVDEAHHIRNPETHLHQGVRYFCDHAQAVVMLTATPVQLGSEDLFTLLNVLRPDLIVDLPSFREMAAPNRHINAAAQACRTADPDWQKMASRALQQIPETGWGRLFLQQDPAFRAVQSRLRDGVLNDAERVRITHDIEGLYTFGSIINRTRRRDIGAFTMRKPQTREVPFTAQQQELHDELLDVMARILRQAHGDRNVAFMMSTVRRQAASCLYGLAPLLEDILEARLNALEVAATSDDEQIPDPALPGHLREDIRLLLQRARTLDTHDPKTDALLKVLREKDCLPLNKVLIFSSFRHTLSHLLVHVRQAGMRVGVIHGDVPDEERRELRQRFAMERSQEEAIDVLLSSEVGSEGLDFQFCDMLVNYDLPWNPTRIEQRIGRLDRYGQTSEAIAIVNFITPGTVDADIYSRCLLRIGVFQQAVGGSEEILGEIARELHHIAESFNLTEEERGRRLQQLADNSIRDIQEQQALEAQQADLFGLNIPRQDWEADLQAAQSRWLSPAAIRNAVDSYLGSRLGRAPQLPGDRSIRHLRSGQSARDRLLEDFLRLPRSGEPAHRAWEKWLKGSQPLLAVTFDQDAARETPEAAHLSVTHPLVRQAARFLDVREARETSLRVTSPDLPSGTHHFALYRWFRHGVRPDELLVPVAEDERVRAALPDILLMTEDGEAPPPSAGDREKLDALHYSVWAEAQVAHVSSNRQLVEFRRQSLTVSHRSRLLALRDQVQRVRDGRIRTMKESEMIRAEADFERRMSELRRAAESGDIRVTPVLFGSLEVIGGSQP